MHRGKFQHRGGGSCGVVTLVTMLMLAMAGPASAISLGGAPGDGPTMTLASPALAGSSGVLAWGSNHYGQLGNGSETELSDVPVPVSGLSGVTAVSDGGSHSLALLSNGTVVAWGSNYFGELGNGTHSEGRVNHPVPVSGLSGVIAIAAGANHNLALLSNGTVVAWGWNSAGKLGDGSFAGPENCASARSLEEGRSVPCSTRPVPVSGLSGVTAISAGDNSLALLSDGTVVAWGPNSFGSLGNGTYSGDSDVPMPVISQQDLSGRLTGVSAISAGVSLDLAELHDGTVMEWGKDGREYNIYPVAVSGLSGVSAIAAGSSFGLALLSDGTVMSWGENNAGQLGNGTTRNEVLSAVLTGATAISAGRESSLALLGGGNVMAWGSNQEGELGDGSNQDSLAPLAVSGLSGVSAISAGDGEGGSDLAISTAPHVATIEPNNGSFAGGTSVNITGINFTGATAVRFGSTPATNFKVASATSISAVAPPGVGTVDVTVTTAAGTSAVVAADQFRYQPAVVDVEPNFGRPAGGTRVTIAGSGFKAATTVRFGSRRARAFTVHSPSSITAIAPAGAGTVDVTVTTPGGTSTASSADLFTYTTLAQWSVFPTPNLGELDGVSCLSARFCMAVGSSNETLEWNGRAWVALPIADPPQAVSCSSSKFCAAVGSTYYVGPTPDSSGFRAFAQSWNGTTWSGTPIGGSRNRIDGVSCVSPKFCVAVGGHTGPTGGPEMPVAQMWNGVTWSAATMPLLGRFGEANALTGVSCASIEFCVAVGSQRSVSAGPEAGALIESWNGTEWSVVPSPRRGSGPNDLNGVSCVSAKHCVAVGVADGALAESWNGSAWSILDNPNLENSSLSGVSCTSGTSCVAVGADEIQGEVRTLVEVSNGSHWSLAPSANVAGAATHLTAVSCISNQSCLAVGGDNTPGANAQDSLIEFGRF